MPTPRGWLVGLTGVALWIVGVIFGADPVTQLGFALVVLVAIAVAVVRLGRHEVSIERVVAPERTAVGRPVTVTMRITNDGRGRAPLMLMEDRLPARVTGNARFAVNGIEPQGQRETTLQIVAHHRGRFRIGPMSLAFVDPFGLARLRVQAAPQTSFLVHPNVSTLSLPRDVGERHSLSSSAVRQFTGARGEDFYTMREYVPGDDLRKVHWGSTAKRARFMIRQEETPWHARATILLDDRAAPYTGSGESSSFERVVEAAASIANLYHRVGYAFRLAGADELGIKSARGGDHYRACLDLLATIRPSPGSTDALIARLAELEKNQVAEAALVVVTGTLQPAVGVGLTRCRRRFKQVSVVSFPAHRFAETSTRSRWEGETGAMDTVRLLARSGIKALVLGPDEPLAFAWSSVMQGRTSQGATGWDPKQELV